MKHCSQGSSTCVKNVNIGNYTLISRTRIQRKFLLGFLNLRETTCMEKHADTSEKYLWRIANFMTTHNNKRKRNGIDEEDNDDSNDDK
jgi:hypothetical protein